MDQLIITITSLPTTQPQSFAMQLGAKASTAVFPVDPRSIDAIGP
jgi:hypothetical protein